MSFSKWLDEQPGYDIQNNHVYRDWIHKNFCNKDCKQKQFIFFHILYKKNIKALTKIFGKQTGIWVGEFRFYIWKREFKGYTFLIFSSNKGTSYELITNNLLWDKGNKNIVKEGKIIIEFIEDVLKKLKEYYSNDNSKEEQSFKKLLLETEILNDTRKKE